jgi:divinyl chlorophyllide a 8-vinyl-reductase
VQKPRLEFQRAKLAFEAEPRASALGWTIIRPNAHFKSLSGQVERVRAGRPFLVSGDGRGTACKPISDADPAVAAAGRQGGIRPDRPLLCHRIHAGLGRRAGRL